MIVCALFELIFFALILSGSSSDDPRNFNDIWLPGFHFVPYPFNSINDPNGPFYDPIHGYYHLFYQYRTPRTWGHAASPNLVDWMQLPIALDRTEWYDVNGDFSGSATVLNDENRSIVLTVSTPEGHIFTAMPVNRSDPYLREWAYSDDPDASGTSQPLFTPDYECRDPTEMLSLSQGGYQMFVGSEAGTQLWQVFDSGLRIIFSRLTLTIVCFHSRSGIILVWLRKIKTILTIVFGNVQTCSSSHHPTRVTFG
jgi:sucrose-6-phosphate hydrolase SacC (GH32 family)